jgi:hypothetical protein
VSRGYVNPWKPYYRPWDTDWRYWQVALANVGRNKNQKIVKNNDILRYKKKITVAYYKSMILGGFQR